MKTTNKWGAILVCFCIFVCLPAFADTIVMSNNRTITGNVIQTNGDDVLILTPYAAFNYSATSIKGIKTEPADTAESSNPNRLPDFQTAILFLSKQPWATNLTPIPATVIDKGILRNVPYASFHCGVDYEVNIYGDLENPSGIEIGIYRTLLDDGSAKDNCIKFVSSLLSQSGDREIVLGLDLNKDLKTRDELTFEITPTNGEDSYNGWWVSVYSEKQLNLARASDSEMSEISMTQADAAKDVKDSTNTAAWSASELKMARPSARTRISFVTSSGILISNAVVVQINDGVSLIWRSDDATSGGLVRLADLPEDLRVRFGYDEVKTKAAADLAATNQARWRQEASAAAAAQAATPQPYSSSDSFPSYTGSYSSGNYSGGGSVYVHGYYRSNGTYVNAYTRSYPHRR